LGQLDRRSSVALRRLLSEGVLSLSVQARRNTARMMARAELYEIAGMSQLEDGNPLMLANCISQAEYEAVMKETIKPAPSSLIPVSIPSVEQQWADLGLAVDGVLVLARQLESRRLSVGLTVSQMGAGWVFDGVNYSELQQVISVQLQAIHQLFSRPERMLCLLPSIACLHKGRGREHNTRLKLLQQRAFRTLQSARVEALVLVADAIKACDEGSCVGLVPVFVAQGGGMAIIKPQAPLYRHSIDTSV